MSDFGVQAPAKNAVSIDPHQGGNKAAPRGGANNGIVKHQLVDSINHGAQSVKVKDAMSAMGHSGSVEYYHGGKM